MGGALDSYRAVSAVVRYCPFSGNFYRFRARKGWRKTGFLVGGGYMVIFLFGKNISAARVAWFLMKREWPSHEVDHIDLNKQNNRWINLRLAMPSENCANKPRYSNNSSGFKGVSRFNDRGVIRWRARVGVNGKRISLGVFDSPEEAYAAYVAASAAHHKEFSRVA
jgi:hypothetical protein